MKDINEVRTVKDLITVLLEHPMDQEVLYETDDNTICCMLAELDHEDDEAPFVDVDEPIMEHKVDEIKPHPGRPKKNYTAEDYMHQAEYRKKYYDRYYGATAFKYEIRRWTPREDDIVMRHPEKNDLLLSAVMKRSVAAIHTRRYNLRKKGYKG